MNPLAFYSHFISAVYKSLQIILINNKEMRELFGKDFMDRELTSRQQNLCWTLLMNERIFYGMFLF